MSPPKHRRLLLRLPTNSTTNAPNQGVYPDEDPGVDNPGVEDDLVAKETTSDDDNDEESDNEQNEHNDDVSQDLQNSAPDRVRTESERFHTAENEGRTRATQQNATQPTRNYALNIAQPMTWLQTSLPNL